MKVSGFTVIRNAELMGYPVVESIRSVLPIVDEFVIGVGQSEDNTKKLIESINDPKIKIFDSFWDTSKVSGGKILSEKTNEALARCSHNWCFYIQADEVVHEADLDNIVQAMKKFETDSEVEGLLFKYIHFYGSYNVIATARNWYRNEVRVVKKNTGIQSYNDAQGFRVHGRKPKVRAANAHIHHYGWVKPPEQMGLKSKLLNRLWHGNKLDSKFENFQYDVPYGLKIFKGSHPKVMNELIANQSWTLNHEKSIFTWSAKDWNFFASDMFEKLFRHRIGEYKNYILLR